MTIAEIPDYVWMTALIVGLLCGAAWVVCSGNEDFNSEHH